MAKYSDQEHTLNKKHSCKYSLYSEQEHTLNKKHYCKYSHEGHTPQQGTWLSILTRSTHLI